MDFWIITYYTDYYIFSYSKYLKTSELKKWHDCPTPHKIKPGSGFSMTRKQKYKNIQAVDTQSGCTPGQFLCGER